MKTDVEKVEKKKFTKKRRAVLKEKKRREAANKKRKKLLLKEHKKEVERLNRKLTLVSRSTYKSLGIVSFDAGAGTIRKENNEWIKTYRVNGLTKENKTIFIDSLLSVLTLRARLTSKLKKTPTGYVREDYLTFYVAAETYEAVKNLVETEVKAINRLLYEINIAAIDLNKYMNVVQDNYQYKRKDNKIDYCKSIRRKHNWKDMAFTEITTTDYCYETDGKKGICLNVIQYPEHLNYNVWEELYSINRSTICAMDIQPLSNDSKEALQKILNKRYNQQMVNSEKKYFNVGYTLLVEVKDDSDAKKIDELIETVFCDSGMVIAQVCGNQEQVINSTYSLGICDYRNMRNIDSEQIKQLVV